MAYAGKTSDLRRSLPRPNPQPSRGLPADSAMKSNAASRRGMGVLATGIAIGLVVGVGVALLLAPQSGADTRYGLKRGLRRVGRRGRTAWDDLREEFRHARRQLQRARRRARMDRMQPMDAEPRVDVEIST